MHLTLQLSDMANSPRPKISVVINTYNAERDLEQVLESVKDFDEVLVCDMESTDSTVEIAKRHGARVVTFPKGNHTIAEPARTFAIQEAKWPWILVVDADELVTDELRQYLYERASAPDAPGGIYLPRVNYFMGQFIHSAYPDPVLRFFRQEGTVWPPTVHTNPEVKGVIERVDPARKELALIHLANDSVGTIMRKMNSYTDYDVTKKKDRNFGVGSFFTRPAMRFVKSYFIKGGWRDGVPGFVHALLDGVYQTVLVSKSIEARRDTSIKSKKK